MSSTDQHLGAEFGQAADDLLSAVRGRTESEGIESQEAMRAAWAAALDAGWCGVLLAEADGGLGLGIAELAPVFWSAGRHLLAGPLVEHAVLLPMLIAAVERGPGRGVLLEAVTGDDVVIAADVALAPTGIVMRSGVLSGSLGLVDLPLGTSHVLVVATDEDGGIVPLVVPLTRAGISVARRRSLDPSASIADVVFADTPVERADTLEIDGEAFGELADRIRAVERVLVGHFLGGIAEHALEQSMQYAKDRVQFDRPIGSFQAVQHILAEMARRLHGVRGLCRVAAENDGSDELPTIALVLKAHAGSVSRSVVEDALQVHGGIAFTSEHPLHRYYLRVLSLETVLGDAAELELALGLELLEPGREIWAQWSSSAA